MSNIKIIDGINVNLDYVTLIHPDKTNQEYRILFNFSTVDFDDRGMCFAIASKFYKTKEECEARIKEILEKQNNKEVEI